VRNLPCAQPTDEGGLQGCDARTHHPSWSSIILKSTFSITRCCFFYDASFLSFMDCIPWISWNIFMIKNISWSYSFCFLCFSLFFFSWPYLTPKWYRCTREEFMFGTQLVLLYLFVFVTVTNQKMSYSKTCDDGGYVHSSFQMLLVLFFSNLPLFSPHYWATKIDVTISLMQSILGMIFLAWTLPGATK